MTKKDIIKKISQKSGLRGTQVAEVVDALTAEIRSALTAGESVYLRGFRTFERKHRKERKARNIHRETTLTIPTRNIPNFCACPAIKKELM